MVNAPTESGASPRPVAKEILVLLVKLAVTLASLYLIFRSVSLEAVGQLFAHMQVGWFALAVLVFLVAQLVSALRCAYVVRTLGAELSWVAAVRAHFVGLWFNQVLPTGLGGDVVKIALIKAQAGLGIATRAVVIDRVSGLMILMFMLIGAYSLSNSVFDIGTLIAFGVLGYIFRKAGFPLAPAALTLILGPLLEKKMRLALELSGGDLSVFYATPVSGTLLGLAAAIVIWPVYQFLASGYRQRQAILK